MENSQVSWNVSGGKVSENVDSFTKHNSRQIITERSRIWCESYEKNLLFPETLLQTYKEPPSSVVECVNLESN